MQHTKLNLIIVIVIAIIAGVGGFGIGLQYQKSQSINIPAQQSQAENQETTQQGNVQKTNMGGQPQGGATTGTNGFPGKKPVSGEIVSIDKDTLTVKTQDGSSKIVIYSSSTKVNMTTEGTISDLKAGAQITVMGTESTDGVTTTAQSISIGNGLMQGGLPPGGQQPGGSAQQQKSP